MSGIVAVHLKYIRLSANVRLSERAMMDFEKYLSTSIIP